MKGVTGESKDTHTLSTVEKIARSIVRTVPLAFDISRNKVPVDYGGDPARNEFISFLLSF